MDIAFGYARKSPDEKDDTERSIKNQEDLNDTICKGKEWDLRGWFSDKNISGSDRDRKGLKDCINTARNYKIQFPDDNVYIIVKDQYRFARDSAFFQDTLKDLDAYGIKVFSVTKNDFLSHEDLGDNVLSLVSQEAIKKGRKDASLLQQNKINNKLPCIPAPFGYKYSEDKDNKTWIIEKENAKIVQGVVSDYVNKRSYLSTIKDFKINKPKYYRIMKNAKLGLYNSLCFYIKKFKDSNGNVVRTEEIKYPINCEPIVSEELYEKIKN